MSLIGAGLVVVPRPSKALSFFNSSCFSGLSADVAVGIGGVFLAGPGCPGHAPSAPIVPFVSPAGGGAWSFPAFSVSDPASILWVDPDVAIGYIYKVGDPLGPLFDQFTAPSLLFNSSYQIFSSASSCSSDGSDYSNPVATITPNVAYSFPAPLPCFAIKGIDERNALDPANTTAFVAGVSFDKSGIVTLTQIPLNASQPGVPAPLPIVGVGTALGWARRVRRSQRGICDPVSRRPQARRAEASLRS